ncbi:hypothetical protein Fmac_032290 [Flemingia macrophylla]|uniref:Uncharacterized protein n=1 Tax=Flemingia macrophylla TaxID=520843 RepID=A0ABD1L4H4_9FABA
MGVRCLGFCCVALSRQKWRRFTYERDMVNRAVHAAGRGGNWEMLTCFVREEGSGIFGFRDAKGCTVLHSVAAKEQDKFRSGVGFGVKVRIAFDMILGISESKNTERRHGWDGPSFWVIIYMEIPTVNYQVNSCTSCSALLDFHGFLLTTKAQQRKGEPSGAIRSADSEALSGLKAVSKNQSAERILWRSADGLSERKLSSWTFPGSTEKRNSKLLERESIRSQIQGRIAWERGSTLLLLHRSIGADIRQEVEQTVQEEGSQMVENNGVQRDVNTEKENEKNRVVIGKVRREGYMTSLDTASTKRNTRFQAQQRKGEPSRAIRSADSEALSGLKAVSKK